MGAGIKAWEPCVLAFAIYLKQESTEQSSAGAVRSAGRGHRWKHGDSLTGIKSGFQQHLTLPSADDSVDLREGAAGLRCLVCVRHSAEDQAGWKKTGKSEKRENW